MPPPSPPIVKPGRTIAGRPIVGERALGLAHRLDGRAARHPQARRAPSWRGTGRGPRRGGSPRSRRRSARRRSGSSVPSSDSSRARLSAVPPPSVGSSASGRSRSITRATDAGQQRLDVGGGGELGVGHDRRRVRVDEHDLVALLEQHLARLRARVVELGGLADHDRPASRSRGSSGCRRGAASGGVTRRSRKRSKRCTASCGPGPASGWYWTVAPGTSRSTRPSTVRS